MAQAKTRSRKPTNTKGRNNKQSKSFINGNGHSFVATFMGIAVGVPLAVAAMTPVIKAEVSSATSNGARLSSVQVAPAADLLQCAQPTSASSAALSAKPSTAQPSSSPSVSLFTSPAGNISPSFSKKLVGNLFANNTATISDTGPNSTNKVDITDTDTTTVTNNNDVNLTNDNSQSSQSGQTNVSDNTTAGSASTGGASNTNSSSYDLSINN